VRLFTSDGEIVVSLVEVIHAHAGGKARLGFEAPLCVKIMREELLPLNESGVTPQAPEAD
jgi:sRNA-binding carbon storage regulator CsrA